MDIPEYMYAMVLETPGEPLLYKRLAVPAPGPHQVLVKIIACGVCRTDLHIIDGELKEPVLPLIPGHEIVGVVAATGSAISKWQVGSLVGIPWLGFTCGVCRYCAGGLENLCDHARFTGYTISGGYAQYTLAHEDYCIALADHLANANAAPLLCAGLIGYRAYRMVPSNALSIGLYGFGAAAHIILQIATKQHQEVYCFTKVGDLASQQLAIKLGATWAGNSLETCPVKLNAGIIFAPDGKLVIKSLLDTDKGGTVVCAGIYMSDIPSFPYSALWEERSIRSVANLTRTDGRDFMHLAGRMAIQTVVTTFPLQHANEALQELRSGNIKGAAVLTMAD